MKKILAILLALLMVLSFAACTGTEEPVEEPSSEATSGEPTPEETGVHLERDDWADDVKVAVNDFVDTYGVNGEGYDADAHPYVIFDFDNTCSIFDVEEQLAVYQLQVMAFAFTPEELPAILETGLGDLQEDRTDLGYGNGCYQDWIDDITAAYTYLYTTYGPFTAAGLDADQQATVQADTQWQEFATKMRTLYDVVYDAESADVAYPWVLYWFTGMTEDEVYTLATASHTTYKAVETSTVTWSTPADIDATSKVGHVEYSWTSGIQVSENIVELWNVLKENGIDVWVCSASATDPIRAAVDVFGLHDYVTGVLAMTNTLVDGKYVNSYDYTNGYAWLNDGNGGWVRGDVATESQTQGIGKVTAIENVLVSSYGYGPIAGFMDSTGDFNFCTEFADLKLVVCLNRASRKITDGGGLVAEVAIYERDTLGYDLATANAAGDTLYVLQGRDENGTRTLRNSNATLTLGSTEEKLFKNEDNQTELQYMIDNQMTVKDIFDTFSIKTAADDEGNVLALKYGFLKVYNGYHSRQYAAVREDWADDVKAGINDLVASYGKFSEGYDADAHPYVIFDFDNTCSIFDVEEQLAVYQLQVMAFAFTPEELPAILETGLGDLQEDRTDLGYGNGCYQDWIDDITTAYTYLYTTYGPFTAAGLDADQQATVQADTQWQEFATKMRTLYDVVYDAESADVAYPWVLYWFTGMTEDEVYTLATASHTTYKAVETSTVTWSTPADIDATSKVGHVEYSWTSGIQVSQNIVELWKTLDSNGIDVWVCSASATDPIRAAVDVFGLHDSVTGVLAMTNTLVDGEYVNSYDYTNGYAWLNDGKGGWVRGDVATESQTQGIGKVTAINNAIYPTYGYGPIAGFMDSTGDFNFCTEYSSLKFVICLNRASRKITDGGGLVAEVAIYERDTLGYTDLATANAAGDTYYVLQGRDENGMRTLRNSNSTLTLGSTEEKLFKNEDNQTELQYMIDNQMTVKDILDTFSIKTAADAEGNVLLLKYGFLKEYAGYHNIA